MATAFEPEYPAICGADLKVLHDVNSPCGAGLDGGGDDGDVFRKDDLLEGAQSGSLGQGMAKDGIGAGPVGGFAGSIFDVPGGNEGGLLDRCEELLLSWRIVVRLVGAQ